MGATVMYTGGNGTDVNVFSLDRAAVTLTKQTSVNAGSQPSYLAVSPDRKYLYAILEGGSESQVVAYAIDASTGALTKINSASTKGQGAPHLAVHPNGKWIVVAHYGGGQVTILPVAANGGVSDAAAPVATCQNAHQAVFDTTGKYLFVPCLGSNYVLQFKFDGATGTATANTTANVSTQSPRHIALDPQQKHAYVISEYDSTLTWFDYDAATGLLSNAQKINSYKTTAGASAHVVVHPNGRWLYASNRKENSLGLFALDAATGAPSPVTFETDMIATPRDFSLDPSGTLLLLANQDGAQNVLVYKISESDGKLTRSQAIAVGGNPTCTLAITLP